MAWYATPEGEIVEAFDAMADLYRRRGWVEVDAPVGIDTDAAPPTASASRAAWADYAVGLGCKVEDLTKAQIIDAVNSVEVEGS